MRLLSIVITLIFAVFTTGCGDRARSSLYDRINELESENQELTSQVQQLEEQNETLTERIDTLVAIGPEKRADALPGLERIELSKRSGIYDKDNDGKFESLIVYVQPHDKAGDAFKAPGTVNVQLWDLQAQASDALVGKWEVTPDELKKTWAGTIMTDFYRLKLPLDFVPTSDRKYTAKVAFTDYLTGKIFRQQVTVEIED